MSHLRTNKYFYTQTHIIYKKMITIFLQRSQKHNKNDMFHVHLVA
jgi:hypothetical protein